MGGVKKCAVCKRSEKMPGVRLFSFPRQKYRCNQWLQNIGNPELYKFSTYRLSVAYKVCEQHFERNCFFSDMLNRLVCDAVPTLFGSNVKHHVAIDYPILKHEQNKHCVRNKAAKHVFDRVPDNMISVPEEDFADNVLPQEDTRENCLNKLEGINVISQCDLPPLNSAPVCSSKFDDTCNREIITREIKQCESKIGKLAVSVDAHLASSCIIENNNSPMSVGDGVSVEGFVQEGFLHNWMVDDSVLNEDENSNALFGKICGRVTDKQDFVQDIDEVGISFNDASETIPQEEGNLVEGQFSDYHMDVGSISGLDQSDFLQSWMPGKVIISSEKLDEQQCTLSEIAIGLMDERREHAKKNSVGDITVCNWENDKVSTGLPKLSHEDYDLDICEQDSSEPSHLESIFLLGLCEKSHSNLSSNSQMLVCNSLPIQTSNENLFLSHKQVNKRLVDLPNTSKENLQKTFEFSKDVNDSEDKIMPSATLSLLPVENTLEKTFPTARVVHPESVEISNKLYHVTYRTDGVKINETDLNPRSPACDRSKQTCASEFNQSVFYDDQMSSCENAIIFENVKNESVDVIDSKTDSDVADYVLYNFESICRLCLAADQVMYPIFSDTDADITHKEVLSCIPVEVQRDDRYPKFICKKCYDQMVSWFKFKEACFKSQSLLDQFTISTSFDSTGTEKQEVSMFISLPKEPVQENINVISRCTQTVPIVELISGKEPSPNLPGMVQQNKNDMMCQKLKRKRLTIHKKRLQRDMKVCRTREMISSKHNLNRNRNFIGIKSSCSSSISSSQGVGQNKMVNMMKELHFSGLKPGCRLTVADKRYLIVGTKSGSKSDVGLYTKQLCTKSICNHDLKI